MTTKQFFHEFFKLKQPKVKSIDTVYSFKIVSCENKVLFTSPYFFLSAERAKVTGDITIDCSYDSSCSVVVFSLSVFGETFKNLTYAPSVEF